MIGTGEEKVECPYDSTHIICKKFISKHLIKCRENHKTHKKVVCKFDKTHLVPRPELPYHLSICESRYLLDRELQLKASKGVEGLHCGDVIGPKIVKNHYNDTDEEEWGSEPASGAPVAMFNRREMDFETDESDAPHKIPGANYPSRLPRNAAAVSGTETCRKFPNAPSKVAQVAEMSKKATQPGSDNQVFMYSLSQTLSNPGFGRGRGNNQQQALKAVGVLRSHIQDPAAADSANIADQVNMPQFLNIEKHPNGYQQSHDLTPEVNNLHSVSRLDNSSLKQQQKDFYNQQCKETLAQVYGSSIEQSENYKGETYRPETFTTSEQPMNTPMYQNQTNEPLLPKGRGSLHGVQQLRRPASSSFVQGSNYSNLPGASRMEGNSGGNGINEKSQQNSIHDDDSSFTDADDLTTEDFQRAERKLRKKLRQLTVLEEKSAAGIQLNEEEKCKLKRKDEIISLIQTISKHH